MAEQYVMVDDDNILYNPKTGIEANGTVHTKAIFGWNPVLSSGITVNTGPPKTVTPPTTFHNNVKDAIIPYFDPTTKACTGVLQITSNSGTSPFSFTKLSGVDPVTGDYLLSPQIDFPVIRCGFNWADIEAVEGVYAWDAMEITNSAKVARELNDLIDDPDSGYVAKKKQITLGLCMDDSMRDADSSTDKAHAGICPDQSGQGLYIENVIGADGNFGADSNSDGVADGWTASSMSVKSVSSNVQNFTADSQYDYIKHTGHTNTVGDKIYMCAWVKCKSGATVKIGIATSTSTSKATKTLTATTDDYEFVSCEYTAAEGFTDLFPIIQDHSASGWDVVSSKKVYFLNRTELYGAGNEPTKATLDTKYSADPAYSAIENSNKIVLDVDANSTDDRYNDWILYITKGTGFGQYGVITDYDGTSKLTTMTDTWTTQPDNTSVFVLFKYRQLPDWLMEDMTTGSVIDGKAYVGGNRAGFSPNYANAALIAAFGTLMEEMADHYADDPIFERFIFGVMGLWGELHTDDGAKDYGVNGDNQSPDDIFAASVVDQYLTYVDTYFGAENAQTRRSIGASGTKGFGLFNHSFGTDSQVWSIPKGSIDSFNYGIDDDDTDEGVGIAQAAISDWADRPKSTEPYGGLSENTYMFLDEPTSYVGSDVDTEWEIGGINTTTGAEFDNGDYDDYYRTQDFITLSGEGGAVVLTIKVRAGSYVEWSDGYYMRIYEYDTDHTFIEQSGSLSNNGTYTLDATCRYIKVIIFTARVTRLTMTDAKLIDARPRIYLGTGNNTKRNIEWTMKMLRAYKPLLYCDDLSDATIGSSYTDNRDEFMKTIGYRLGLTVANDSSVIIGNNAVIDVTVHNVGICRTWLPGYYISAALKNKSTGAIIESAEEDQEWEDIDVGDEEINFTLDTTDVPAGTYDVAVSLYHPTWTDTLYVNFYGGSHDEIGWYDTTEITLMNPAKEITTGSDITLDLEKGVGKNISTNVSATLDLEKGVGKNVSADAVITPTVGKRVSKTIGVTVSATPSIGRSIGKSIDVTAEVVSIIARDIDKAILVSVEADTDISRDITKSVFVSVDSAITLQKQVAKEIEVAIEATEVISKDINKSINVVAEAVSTITRDTNKTVLVSVEADTDISRDITKSVFVSVDASITLQKQVAKDIEVAVEATTTTGIIAALYNFIVKNKKVFRVKR